MNILSIKEFSFSSVCSPLNSGQGGLSCVAVVALAAIATLVYRLTRHSAEWREADVQVAEKIVGEIQKLQPTIADSASFSFSPKRGGYVKEEASKVGSIALLAAAARAISTGKQYGESPSDILKLGEDLLRSRSGQCDHVAAAVIVKIVEHIKAGGPWHSKVELLGSGTHAYVVLNREGSLRDPPTWGQAALVDGWLACVGVEASFKERISIGQNGVIKDQAKMLQNVAFFGSQGLRVVHEFTPEELHRLARKK